MILNRTLKFFLIVLVIAIGCDSTAHGQCNKCYRHQTVYPGHGPVSSTDQRRTINVRIDGSWGATTNTNVWNGINGCEGCTGPNALKLWNDVGSPYYFRLRQDPSQANSATDIVIRKGNPNAVNIYHPVSTGACAVTTWVPEGVETSQVREITLPPAAANWSQEHIACVIAHEIGHAVGLSDVYDPNCVTIMNQSKPNCADCLTNNVQQTDADRTNQHAANKNDCNDLSGAPSHMSEIPTPTPTPGGGGPGGGCSSYFNTFELYDDYGGSNCRYTFAVFTTYCGGYLTDYYVDLIGVENCNYAQ